MRRTLATIGAALAIGVPGGLVGAQVQLDNHAGNSENFPVLAVGIDNTGDGVEDVAYRWEFKNKFRLP